MADFWYIGTMVFEAGRQSSKARLTSKILARAPNRGAYAVVRANSCLSAAASCRRGAFEGARSRGLGSLIGIRWKGTRIQVTKFS